MFFRKAKRIKELEAEVARLSAINRYNALIPTTIEHPSIHTICAEVMISKYIPEEVYKKEVIHKLGDGLTKYVTFETIEDPYLPDRFRCRATIRIVKEDE